MNSMFSVGVNVCVSEKLNSVVGSICVNREMFSRFDWELKSESEEARLRAGSKRSNKVIKCELPKNKSQMLNLLLDTCLIWTHMGNTCMHTYICVWYIYTCSKAYANMCSFAPLTFTMSFNAVLNDCFYIHLVCLCLIESYVQIFNLNFQ